MVANARIPTSYVFSFRKTVWNTSDVTIYHAHIENNFTELLCITSCGSADTVIITVSFIDALQKQSL